MIWLGVVLGAVAIQRGAELLHARRNATWLRQNGARLVARDGFLPIVAVHVMFFVLPVAEAILFGVHYGWWTALGAALFLAGQALRYHAMTRLGKRWNTRVFVLPEPLVKTGLYGRIRHPNYVGVVLELAGLPLAFGLWRTAAALGLLNAVALANRIRIEEQELGMRAG